MSLNVNQIKGLENLGISKDTEIECNYCKQIKPITEFLLGYTILINKSFNNMCDICETKINRDLGGSIRLIKILTSFSNDQYPENIYWKSTMKISLKLKSFFESKKFIEMTMKYNKILIDN